MIPWITLAASVAGFLTGRAVAYVLVGAPVTMLRRLIPLILVLLFCGIITAAWYLDQADVRHIIYAAALAALIGFVVSQRSDQTVRLVVCCIVAPILILGSLAVAFLASEYSGAVDWSSQEFSHPSQSVFCIAPLVAFAVSLMWHVPAPLWTVRNEPIQGRLRSFTLAVIACAGAGLMLLGYDVSLRKRLANYAAGAESLEQQLYGTPPTGGENAAVAYQRIVDEFENDDETLLGLDLAIAGVRRIEYPPNLKQHQSHLDQLKAASMHPGRLSVTDVTRKMEFQQEVFVLALGLIARAKTGMGNDRDSALEDLLAVKRIQRHLASDPQLQPFSLLEMLEQRLRIVFEQMEIGEPFDLQSFYSQVPFDKSVLKCKQKSFLARHLHRHYNASPSSLAARGRRFVDRLLWCAHDLDCASKGQLASLHLTIPDSVDTLTFSADQDGHTAFHVQAVVNDIGLYCRDFHAREGKAPRLADLPPRFQRLLDKDVGQVVEITKLSGGCVVASVDDQDLAQLLRETEDRDATPPETSPVLNDLGVMRARRVFLVGDSLARYRPSRPRTAESDGDTILFISPSNEQTFSILSGVRRGNYSDVLAEVRQSIERKHQFEMHDTQGMLAKVLDELCRLTPYDTPWFSHHNDLVVAHQSGRTHQLAFWSLDDLQQRRQRLSKVRRDEFDDALENAQRDFGTAVTNETATKTWNDLTKLADYIESTLDEGRSVIRITIPSDVAR